MCEVCDKLDSMIDCLEILHSIEELKVAMISMTDDEETIKNINSMTHDEVRIEFAINLMVAWTDKYDAFPLKVLSVAAEKLGDRMMAHHMAEEHGDE